jgi:hypothetical protein
MKKRTQIILRILAALLAVLAFAGTWFYVVIWEPHRRFYRNEAWWQSASTNEIRSLCHHIISHRPGCPHDAFLHLRRIGNGKSVPLLIRALKWQRPVEGEIYICTTAHCVDALRSLTGEDFGFSPSAWEEWWEQTGSKLPDDHFHQREIKKEEDSQQEHYVIAPPLRSGSKRDPLRST